MSLTVTTFTWPVIGYLFGSVSCAILISKLFSLTDPREVGSGNPGSTNVLRSGNKLAAALTLLGDVLKGFIPVLLASHFTNSAGIIAVTAIAAFLGHLYPLYHGFKGGKGVATAIGVFLAINPILFAGFAVTWLVVAFLSRYSSLSALLASAATFVLSFVIFQEPEQFSYIGAIFFIVVFLFKRHRENIERLRAGTESKIGQK